MGRFGLMNYVSLFYFFVVVTAVVVLVVVEVYLCIYWQITLFIIASNAMFVQLYFLSVLDKTVVRLIDWF